MEQSAEIRLDLVDANPNQPRRIFDPVKLNELAASITEHGVMEPIVVTPRNGRYFLIAGERRTRAARLAGKVTIPAHIREVDDRTLAELALLENIQREDLTPLEEALAYQGFLDNGYTVEGLAKVLGFRQPWRITERLRLLKLKPHYQEAFAKGILNPLQANYLSKLVGEDQDTLFRAIRDGKADTDEKLRAMTNAILDAKAQPGMFEVPPPDPKAREVHNKYTRLLARITDLLNRSFDAEDLTVLRRALEGDVQGNLERIELVIAHLGRIKKALLGQAATQQLLLG